MSASAKGIFPAPSSKGIPLRAYNQRKRAAKLRSDRDKMLAFADLLAEGYEPDAAALMLGWVPEFGHTMLGRIIKKLGPQAA
jgi:hypothetical protein